MAAQEVERSAGKKRRSIFSGKLRTITIFLAVISALVGLIFWIIAINNENTHIDKIMGAIFTFLLLICAFFTIPIISDSEEPQESKVIASPQTQQASAPPQIAPSVNPADNAAPGGKNANQYTTTQPGQQSPAGNAPGMNQPLPPASQAAPSQTPGSYQEPSINRNDLLDLLSEMLPPLFEKVVTYIKPPGGVLDGAQTVRAGQLITWVERPGGEGLQTLYEYYLRANGQLPEKKN